MAPLTFNVSDPCGWRFDHSYSLLPSALYVRVEPTPVTEPRLILLNRSLAQSLGLDPAGLMDADLFSGNRLPPGALPLAQAYAGHQYGHFTNLGDGRAVLVGEHLTPSGERFDIQLKGSGPTPFSRRGDGRAALGPMLREYIISEAMSALGIPTTRSLAVVASGEKVVRQEMLPGAVLTRVAASHIRVGTFEWAAARGEIPVLRALADHTLARHYPEVVGTSQPYVAFFEAVMESQAALIAQWMRVGFIHGVMNTDNMALSGETIDYGPCAFMDAFDPATVFSSIDQRGRYAFGNQPAIAQWNLARLAEALLPLLHDDESQAVEIANGLIDDFMPRYKRHWLAGMSGKLGLFNEEPEDADLVQSLLDWMQRRGADFTNTFHDLGGDPSPESDADYLDWLARWQSRLSRQPQSQAEVTARMRAHNPAVIPRNHKVEEALNAASQSGDLTVLENLLKVVSRPYDIESVPAEYREPQAVPGYRTFCGT